MTMDLEERIKNYAKGHVDTVKSEYERQITKWQMHLNIVADKQADAFKAHQDTLARLRAKEAANAQIAMMALSMVGTIAVSWISASIQYRLFPKSYSRITDTFTPGVGYSVGTDYNKVLAKVVGDSISKTVGLGLDRVFSSVLPPKPGDRKEDPALAGAITAGTLNHFKTHIENALLAYKLEMTGQFGMMVANINQKKTFGRGVLDELEKPGEEIEFEPEAREDLAKQSLDKYFDALRKKYAEDWFYFGNNPVPGSLTFLDDRIEKEIWALWILYQDYKIVEFRGVNAHIAWGKDRVKLGEIILGRLVEIGETSLYDLEWQTESHFFDNPIDDQDDLQKIIRWAHSHPGAVLAGRVESSPRTIPSITDPAKVFAS